MSCDAMFCLGRRRDDAPPSEDAAAGPSAGSVVSLSPARSPPAPGPRFKLLRDGDVHVCHLGHTTTLVSKILSSKFLRRWEAHHLHLNDACISSKTPSGFMEKSISYSALEDVYIVARWDVGQRFCVRIVLADGSLLLQANNAYTRDQWYHSIQWKKNIFKFRNIIKKSSRPEVVLKELKNLVEFSTSTPLQDECVTQVPIEIVSKLLNEDSTWSSRSNSIELISTLAPLLDNNLPSQEMCKFFSQHCLKHPRSPAVSEELSPIVYRILKRNVDFGKAPNMRRFVQDYIHALYAQNSCEDAIRSLVSSAHGMGSTCPHPRVLPNLVSVCLAAVFSNFEERRTVLKECNEDEREEKEQLYEQQLHCYVSVLNIISEYDDWLPGLSLLLQPIPFPEEAISNEHFLEHLLPVIRRIGTDSRCEVHQMVLAIREGKSGWFNIYCPSSTVCVDDGKMWCNVLQTLMDCCCKRKRFLKHIANDPGPCLLMALREHQTAQQVLCLLLEWEMVDTEDQRMQIVTTLQSTESGRAQYTALCQRQQDLRELQQLGGPKKLTLPSRSTDADIARLLSCGCFGNLECLSLAFTHVTSACAEQLIKLPALRYLNLWATQFGDSGVLLISEHLPKLQVLNLCETPVTDKALAALTSLTNLRKLNLNSTKLSPQTFERLKNTLPLLQECDVRYTEAW